MRSRAILRRSPARLAAIVALAVALSALLVVVLGGGGKAAPRPGKAESPRSDPAATAQRGILAPPEPQIGEPVLYVAPTGDDRGQCSASAPCRKISRAVELARPGDHIQLAAGRYGLQVLGPGAGAQAGEAAIAVRPAPGAAVRLGELRCGRWNGDRGPDGVDIADISARSVVVQQCDRFTLRDVTIKGGVFVNGSTNFSMIGGSVGPGVDYHPDVAAVYESNPSIVPRNVLFDGVEFHDWTLATPGVHIECLQVSDVHGFTLRNSTFSNCDTFDVHIDGTVAGPVKDVVIEGNEFGKTGDHTNGKTPAYYGFSIRDGENVYIGGNRAAQAFAMPAPEEAIADWILADNRAPLEPWQCDARLRYERNEWDGARCGPTDR
jgi:hypothetical protein